MMRDTQQPAEQGRMDGRPGELGVYLLQGAGPGVAIAQIAGGSAAEAAGLLAGDVILQINNQAVEEPRQITRIIRATPAGEIVALRILRDGQEQDVQATLQTGRFSNRVAFRGSDSQVISGDLSSRTQRLEEQLSMVLRELQQLRQELMQLRAARPGTATEQAGFESQLEQGSTQQPGVPPQQDTRPGAGQSPGQPTTETDTGLPF
jgi:membrane-associated protease RseP (regulator of RpoE activity)